MTRRAPEPPWTVAAVAALLLLGTLLAYQPALRGGFVWDDYDWIVENALLRDPGGLWRIWTEPRAFHQYYPLTHTSFWLEWRLWGESTLGYHAVNAVLHALSAFLLWRVLRGLSLAGAGLAAAVFALHPVAVESVAWITERKNTLSLALALASLHVFLPLIDEPEADPLGAGRRRYAAASALFALALLAKTAVVTLPGVLLLLRWWRHGRLRRVDLAALGPWLGAGALLGLVTAWLERVEVGAHGSGWALALPERALVAGRALWFYAEKLVFPRELLFIYPRWEPSLADPLQLLPPLLAAGALVGLYLGRRRLGRGPFVAAAAFAGVLSPTLGFFDVYATRFSFVADHWAYHAAPVLIAALAHGAARLGAALPAPARRGAALGLIGALFALTRAQAALYVDQETLYRDTLAKNPAAFMAHANLGVLLIARGEAAEGITHLAEARLLAPEDLVIALDLAMALQSVGRDAEAARQLEAALAEHPAEGALLNALAGLLARSRHPSVRDPARAVLLAERAVELASPAPAEAWATLAQARAAAGQREAAREAARQGLERARAEGNARMEAIFERWLAGADSGR